MSNSYLTMFYKNSVVLIYETTIFINSSLLSFFMVKRIGGFRRKTRHKLQKNVRRKGKISLTRFFQEFKPNDKVVLNMEPAYHKGIYFPRFHGKIGTVIQKKGTCFEVVINDHSKKKTLIVHPVHLKRL